jgi:hypothetical protein
MLYFRRQNAKNRAFRRQFDIPHRFHHVLAAKSSIALGPGAGAPTSMAVAVALMSFDA